MDERISVVVPVYNMGDSLERCVASVLTQEGVDMEVILVDDGSTDDSWERCRRLMASDGRVRAFHTENRGSGPARDHGVAQAGGRYVYFPDADDLLAPGALKRMLEAIRENSADLLVFGYRVLDEDGRVRREKTYPDFVRDGESIRQDYADFAGLKTKCGIQGAPWNKLFDLQVIREHTVSFPPLRRHQDEGFIARYMCHAQKVQFIGDQLYTHYANSQALEWKKFPVDYAETVHALYRTRQETILSWNPSDLRTQQVIRQEYTDNLVKALELSFSPKHTMTAAQRRAWAAEHVQRSGICGFEIYGNYSRYKKLLLHLLRAGGVGPALLVMRAKIFLEGCGLDWMSRKYR